MKKFSLIYTYFIPIIVCLLIGFFLFNLQLEYVLFMAGVLLFAIPTIAVLISVIILYYLRSKKTNVI